MEQIKQEILLFWKCCPNGQWHSYHTGSFGLKLVLCLFHVTLWKILDMAWDVALLPYHFLMTLLTVLACWNKDCSRSHIERHLFSLLPSETAEIVWGTLSPTVRLFSGSCSSSVLDFFSPFFFFFFRGFEKAAKFRRALGHFWTLQVWDIFFVVTILIYQELKWAEKMRRSPHKDHWLLFGNQSYWLIFLLPQVICF